MREEAVVGGPEAVEGEGVLVVIADCLQSAPALVADAVVDRFEGYGGQVFLDGIVVFERLVAGEEGAAVVGLLDEGVRCVAVGLDDCCGDFAKVVFEGQGLLHAGRSSFDGSVVDSSRIIDVEGYVLDGVPMLGLMGVDVSKQTLLGWRRILFYRVYLTEGSAEHESSAAVGNDM